uniref:Uncharacterized protein n=2 Tax=Loa loa TaxID=7209 RepID=A0A1I7VI96_LOALO
MWAGSTFPDISLCMLPLLDESSMTGVDYQVGTEFDFYTGTVYAIVAVPTIVSINSPKEFFSSDINDFRQWYNDKPRAIQFLSQLLGP